jgi:hypothetical protein
VRILTVFRQDCYVSEDLRGFRKITLRGDTDFTQTEYMDGWDEAGVRFVFGMDAMQNLYELAEDLPETAWKRLKRRARYEVKTKPRCRPNNVKEQVVRDNEFENIRFVTGHREDGTIGKCYSFRVNLPHRRDNPLLIEITTYVPADGLFRFADR